MSKFLQHTFFELCNVHYIYSILLLPFIFGKLQCFKQTNENEFLIYKYIYFFAGSSLWEIDTLRHHYCPPVSRYVWIITKWRQICKSISTLSQKEMLLFIYSWSPFLYLCRFVLSLENDLTVRSKTTEVAIKDFSSGSYACRCHLL